MPSLIRAGLILVFLLVTVPAVPAGYFVGMKGCFLLYDMKAATFRKVIGEENCRERLPACSTFKVPLALMAFDAGVLKDENVILKWDGKRDVREEVNRDHNAKTWMRDSVVWFSQRLTPKLGEKKIRNYLREFNYGNQDMTAGLTRAWLVSPNAKTSALKISAYEQVEFMKRLWQDKLPLSKIAMQKTRDITFLEESPKKFRLHGKTGSNFYDEAKKIHLGWFISHLQRGDDEYVVVTNFSDKEPVENGGYGGPRAKQITKNILEAEGLW